MLHVSCFSLAKGCNRELSFKFELHIYLIYCLFIYFQDARFSIQTLPQPVAILKAEVEMEILNKIQKFFLFDRIQNVLKRLKNYYLHEDDDMTEIEQQQFFAPFKEKQKDM